MIKVAICDDDIQFIYKLEQSIFRFAEMKRIKVDVDGYTSGAESHIPISNPVRLLSTDATSEGEALTVIINGCKVAINNHAGRDVIYHTISALRKL